MSPPLDQKLALVTGAARGIGRAIAEALAQAGCRVVASDVLAGETPPGGLPLEERELDVTCSQSIDRLLAGLERLDILVNCAGVILRDQQEFESASFARVIDVNLQGTMRMCNACRSLLADSQGCILNTASMYTFFGSGHVPAYSASKGGVGQLTKSLAIAWAPQQIRVNALAPGWIKTSLTAPLCESPERSGEILRRTPMGRWGTPEDVAGAAVFLCSPAAAFITGVVLPVDGGYSIA